MKLIVTWCKKDRGLGIGLLVGALSVGSASPHLLNALPELGALGTPSWQAVLLTASGLALLGALIATLFVRQGPFAAATAPFDWRYAATSLMSAACVWQTLAIWAICGSCTRFGPGRRSCC